jgi:hypothetical protein
MSETQQRQYRALNGEEVTDYILAEFRKALVNSGELPLHRVFHELQFVGGVKIRGWGSKPVEVRFSGTNGDSHPDGAVEMDASVTVQAEPEAPSLVRERLALAAAGITEDNRKSMLAETATSNEEPSNWTRDPVARAVVQSAMERAGIVVDSEQQEEASQHNGYRHNGESSVVATETDGVTTIDPLTCAKGCSFIAKSQAGKLAHERHCKGHPDVVK